MATIRIGKLGLKTQPIQLLADWRKVREFDWRALNMGYTDIAMWNCETQKMTPALPRRIPLPFSIMSSFITPLGRQDKEARQRRYNRFIGWSGLGNAQAFGNALSKRFKTPTLDVPQADILQQLDKNYRSVITYLRFDRFILLVPDQPNPQGDYLILCVPDRVIWYIVRVGICGEEELVTVGDFLMDDGEDALPIREWVFTKKGPYKKLDPPRVRGVPEAGGKREIYRRIPTQVKSPGWRKLLRDDEAQKRALANKFGGGAGKFGRWSFLHNWNYDLSGRRLDAEVKRIKEKYG